ncbi:MAG: permease-like cell division protein FtsX [Ruminococcus sp.]|nr:permease-like cell division protein FtsX [Oscillospiraceae bacterium]MDY4414383.1 permease-like cell division protein FtsX [Ruminococcus sp.]
MKLSGIKYLIDQGTENIWKNKMMAFATFCVLLISLMLVGMAVLFYINIDSIIGGISDKNEIAVFIDDSATQEQIEELGNQLSRIDGVSEVVFESKDEAFQSMMKSMPEYERIFNSLGNDNPLVNGYKVRVHDIDRVTEIIDIIEKMDNIYYIKASQEFVNILMELRRVVTLIATAIIIGLVIVSMIMISNTTKASVFSRREEIQIMKYVGATNGFIRIPFFIEGMITGFFSGAGAFLLTLLTYRSTFSILTENVGVMNVIGLGSIIPFGKIQFYVLGAYILAGAFIGGLGSVLCTRKHINV